MIILTEEQAKQRLDNSENLIVKINDKRVGNHTGLSRRAPGDVKSIEEKQLMAALAIDNKLQGIPFTETAKELGIHVNTLNDYVHGKLTNNPGSDLSVRKPEAKENLIGERASEKIVNAIEKITDEKLNKSDASELASVAQKLAQVVERTSGQKNSGAKININIYAPQLLQENHFESVDA